MTPAPASPRSSTPNASPRSPPPAKPRRSSRPASSSNTSSSAASIAKPRRPPTTSLPPKPNPSSKKEIAACDAVILSDYAKGILTDELVARITKLARDAGKFVALDPKPKRKLSFQNLDLITPNKREALQLAGIEPVPHGRFPAAEVCARLHELYATKHLVITLGEDGMLLSSNGKILKTIPTAAREVYDVSGAGDTSLAALVLALVANARLEDAAHFANAAAGVVVGKLGTATVTPKELTDYVNHR